MAAPTSRPANARRRSRIWGRVALVGFFVMLIAGVTANYFGSVHEEVFYRSTGRFLDCGTIFVVNHSPAAQAECFDASSGDLIGFILMAVVIAASIAAIVAGTIGERRGSWRR